MSIHIDDFLPSVVGGCNEDNTDGSYESFSLAEIACALDKACVGVLDEGCDNDGTYRLCKIGFMYPSDSCIHKKKEYTGMCPDCSLIIYKKVTSYRQLYMFIILNR